MSRARWVLVGSIGVAGLAVALLVAGPRFPAARGVATLLTGKWPPPLDAASQYGLETRLMAVAGEYRSWGRVDAPLRWGPLDCVRPTPAMPAFSESADTATHGQKLYSLFARNRGAYLTASANNPSPVGQVIVKQSWVPEKVKDPISLNEFFRRHPNPEKVRELFYPYAWKGDRAYTLGKQADLFIMMKLDPATPETDAGWVYATVTPGKEVIAAGRIESCMRCHQQAKTDRLFGSKQ